MLKMKQIGKTNHSEFDEKCNQSMFTYCGKTSHKCSEVNFFSSSQNRGKGGLSTTKTERNLLSMLCNIDNKE